MKRKKSIELFHRINSGEKNELDTESKTANNDFLISSKLPNNEIIAQSIIGFPEIEMEFSGSPLDNSERQRFSREEMCFL